MSSNCFRFNSKSQGMGCLSRREEKNGSHAHFCGSKATGWRHKRGWSWNTALVCTSFALFPLDDNKNPSPLMCSKSCILEGGESCLPDCFQRNSNRRQGGFPAAVSSRGCTHYRETDSTREMNEM